ncbi:MAG: HAD-IA family hydrolase [Paracoccaceae bacterium]|nr:HAD-IA family hydrolase [Paracoccaceae bacterium]MDE2912790.1 HAD-IA family hydrolase [Paracoccaceae bacterium]
MKAAVFDLDGTLADTSRDLIRAANSCLAGVSGKFGSGPLDPGQDAATAFAGGRAMIRLGLTRLGSAWSETEVDSLYLEFLAQYADAIDLETVLYPGVAEALGRLAERGYARAVCTNKPEALALELLGRLGILDRFGAVLGADSLPVRKPDPEHLFETIRRVGGSPRQSVLVGDTSNDRETARRAGIPCILVTFGPNGSGVQQLEPEGLLDSFEDLPRLVDSVIRADRNSGTGS